MNNQGTLLCRTLNCQFHEIIAKAFITYFTSILSVS